MKLIDFQMMRPVEGSFGIEVEVEGNNLPQLDNTYWSTHNDGSLRGEAYEYVTKGAVNLETVSKAMRLLNASFKKKGSELNLSYRTSVHVHMNVQELEIDKIISIIYLYYLYEELLMKFSGEERSGNRFCLRLRDSEEIIFNLIDCFTRARIGRLDPNLLKYSSLNIAPLRTYGSIEFRSMRGTTDAETVNTWVNLLNCLKTAPFDKAIDVYNFIENHGIEMLSEVVFGGWLRFIEFEGWEHEVAYNASLALEIPHRVKWVIADAPRKEPVEMAIKKLDAFFAPAGAAPAPLVARNIKVRYDPRIDEFVEDNVPNEEEEEEEF